MNVFVTSLISVSTLNRVATQSLVRIKKRRAENSFMQTKDQLVLQNVEFILFLVKCNLKRSANTECT